MTFGHKVFAGAVLVFLAGIASGCSSSTDADIYGYEEGFVAPEPDMVPSTPDDKPGRTVDEMLHLRAAEVTVIKKEEAAQLETLVPEQQGRFGSKEKMSLRKGLNAPAADQMFYGDRKREDVTVVRPLPQEETVDRNKASADMEEKILAEIIGPTPASVEVIEVVRKTTQEGASSGYQAPPSNVTMIELVEIKPAPETIGSSSGASLNPVQERVALTAPTGQAATDTMPLLLLQPVEALDQDENPVLVEPRSSAQTFVLRMPEEVQPEQDAASRVNLVAPQSEPQPFVLALPPVAAATEPQETLTTAEQLGVINFGEDKKVLPSGAATAATIKTAADAVKKNPKAKLVVVGYDQPSKESGKKAAAEARAKAVRDALIKRGVPANKIKTNIDLAVPYGEKTGNHAEIYLES